MRHVECTRDSCYCHNVFRIEDRCYAGAYGIGQTIYDCALSDAEILAAAFRDHAPESSQEATPIDCDHPRQWVADVDAGQ